MPPAPGAWISGHPSAAAGTARVRSRPPLPRPAQLEQLCPPSPSGPRLPRAAAAPVPAHPGAGASGGSPAAAIAPRCFPLSVLVCISPSLFPPTAPQPGRSSGPARFPRGFWREDEAVSPLTPSWEAGELRLLPSVTPTRGRGAPRKRRGKGSCSVGSHPAPQGSRGVGTGRNGPGSAVPTCTVDTDSQGAGQTQLVRGCGSPTATGMGAAAPGPIVPGGHDQLPIPGLAGPAGPCARCRRVCPLRSTFPGTGFSEPRPRRFTSRPATSLN